jgi:uncharacterized protein (DUF2062 family)
LTDVSLLSLRLLLAYLEPYPALNRTTLPSIRCTYKPLWRDEDTPRKAATAIAIGFLTAAAVSP